MKARILTPLIFAVLTFSCNQTEELKKIPDERKTSSVNDIIVETIEDSNTANEPNNVPVEDTIRPAFEPNKPDKTKGEYVGMFDKGQRKNLSGFSTNDVLLKWTKALFDSVHFAENGNDIIVELNKIEHLLTKGANPNWINTERKSAKSILSRYVERLGYSVDPNNVKKGVKAVKLLFKHGAKLQYCDGTILFWPIANDQYEMVKLLLENGASGTFWPKEEIGGSDYNNTPIVEATEGGYEKIIDLLVKFGAKRLEEKEANQLRFVEAANFEEVDVLRELVEKGAKVNTTNRNNETALINALSAVFYRYGMYRKVMYLLDLGADVNKSGTTSGLGDTLPLHIAIRMSSYTFRSKDQSHEKEYATQIIKELINKGAFVSGRDKYGRTPLHIAAKYNNVIGAQILIKSGAKLMDKDDKGKTPLDYAESAEMIKLLKDAGAKELP